jgi:hypothetical protein
MIQHHWSNALSLQSSEFLARDEASDLKTHSVWSELGFDYTHESKRQRLFAERGKFDYKRYAKHAQEHIKFVR